MRASALALVTALTLVACGPPAPLANAGRAGLECTSPEQVLELEDSELDYGTAALIACAELEADLDLEELRGELDALARRAREHIDLAGDARQQARDLMGHMWTREGFGPTETALDAGARRLSQVLRSRRGNCVGLTLLYLAVAERVGLDVVGVSIPYHLFPRLRAGGGSVGIEPTDGTLYEDDAPPLAWFANEGHRAQGPWLDDLRPKELFAQLLLEVVDELVDLGHDDRAVELARLAADHRPASSRASRILGSALASSGDLDGAREPIERAVALAPDDPDAHADLGAWLRAAGRGDEAVRAFGRAVELDLDFPPHLLGHARALADAGRFDEALERIARARDVDWTDLHPFRVFATRQSYPDHDALEVEAFHLRWTIHTDRAELLVERTTSGEASLAPSVAELEREVALARLCQDLFLVLRGEAPTHEYRENLQRVPELAADPQIRSLSFELEQRLQLEDDAATR